MKQTENIMGMPITVEVKDTNDTKSIKEVFDYFNFVDSIFSTYKDTSEISRINIGELRVNQASSEVKEILKLAEETKKKTNGYFDIVRNDETIDPSGIVKGWAIHQASKILIKNNIKDFYIDAGGDIQTSKPNRAENFWDIGIQNPFKTNEIIKIVSIQNKGMATSGTYNRGQHIYNPFKRKADIEDIVSITVIGPNIYEADRFATAAFAMGKEGIYFIENLEGFEGYQITREGFATMTTAFNKYIKN